MEEERKEKGRERCGDAGKERKRGKRKGGGRRKEGMGEFKR